MPLFIIQWKDRADEGPALRAATRPGVVKLGGPFLHADETMAGSLMIIEAEDLEAAEAFHAQDPYTRAGLFERSSVEPWRVTIGALG